MIRKQLGQTDLHLSRIGLGSGAFGGIHRGPQDDHVSIQTIHAALDGGINWIQTSPAFGSRAEEVIGRALATISNRPYLITKCGYSDSHDGEITYSLRRQ